MRAAWWGVLLLAACSGGKGDPCTEITAVCAELGAGGDVEAQGCDEIALGEDEAACEAEQARCVEYCSAFVTEQTE
jgi:hypothetical protein